MKKLFVFILSLFICLPLQGNTISALIHNGDTVISSSDDGFISFWNTRRRELEERFQLTHYSIQSMVKHPLREEICIVERASFNQYIISVWNYNEKRKLFSINSRSSVSYINYSAQGNFIIAAGLNGSVITLINSITGEIISSPDIPYGIISLAITGRAERNIMIYMSNHFDSLNMGHLGFEGQILYFDLNTMSLQARFHAPSDLINPVIFGNNSFIAGVNRHGLLLISASTGNIIDRIDNVNRNAMLLPLPSNEGFYLLYKEENNYSITRYTVNHDGSLAVTENITVSSESIIINKQESINEISASFSNIAFLTEKGGLCFLPLDYSELQNGQELILTNKSGYTYLTSVTDFFILWQNENLRLPVQAVFQDNNQPAYNLTFMQGRFPLRSVSSFQNRVMTLDTAGNVSIFNSSNFSPGNNSVRADFTHTAAAAFDAVLINDTYYVITRGIVRGAAPFQFVNYRTRETISLSFPQETLARNAGITAYSGTSENIYAAATEQNNNEIKTLFCSLSPQGISILFEYPRETNIISIAESGGLSAFVSGSKGAFILTASEEEGKIYFERTAGLPLKVLGSENYYITLDSEGNIAWHDNKDGRLLAVFILFEDRWVLKRGNIEISGGLLR